MSRSFVSRGRRSTWHVDVFGITCRKSFCLAGALLVQRFHVLHFSWQAQHFGRVHLNFSWQAQHFRLVVLHVKRVFCESHLQGCAKW